jgi:hypothetical protein
MFGRGVLLKGQNFRPIVIVVSLHVLKFYRILKKLTDECRGIFERTPIKVWGFTPSEKILRIDQEG